jgi:SAM-dependent methyltransferase
VIATISTGESAKPREWQQRLPRASFVNREAFLVERSRGRDVIHIGFVDAECADARSATSATRLHEQLAAIAKTLVGLDLDESGVRAATANGYSAHAVDCTSRDAVWALNLPASDIVVAGEVLEHVTDPAGFLEAMKILVKPSTGQLVITTPNASRLYTAICAMAGIEIAHPGHVATYSYSTLGSLLQMCGWEVEEWLVYGLVRKKTRAERGVAFMARHPRAALLRMLMRAELLASQTVAPFAGAGLIVVCRNPAGGVGFSTEFGGPVD